VEAGIRRVSWAMVGFVVGLPLVVILVGLLLWWPPCPEPDRSSDLGSSIVGGGIVAFVVLYLDQVLSQRQEKNILRLQLCSSQVFEGIDLSHQDLSGLHLPNRNFSFGDLRGADLRGPTLVATNFERVKLDGADPRGANFRGAPEEVHATGLGWARDATFHETSLEDALYDSSTRWPENVDPKQRGAINLDERGRWRRARQWIRDRVFDVLG
jgi:hypothetical protein